MRTFQTVHINTSKVKSSNHDDLHFFQIAFFISFLNDSHFMHVLSINASAGYLNVSLTPNFQPSCRWPKTLIPNYRLASELLTKRKSRI